MRVKVYRNLRHGRKATPLYSIQHKGKVIRRAARVLLRDVTFVVHEAGRQRVLREGRKNVHAFVVGVLVGACGAFGQDKNGPDLPVRLRYNPYEAGYFTNEGDVRILGAQAVLLNEHGITAAYLA